MLYNIAGPPPPTRTTKRNLPLMCRTQSKVCVQRSINEAAKQVSSRMLMGISHVSASSASLAGRTPTVDDIEIQISWARSADECSHVTQPVIRNIRVGRECWDSESRTRISSQSFGFTWDGSTMRTHSSHNARHSEHGRHRLDRQ